MDSFFKEFKKGLMFFLCVCGGCSGSVLRCNLLTISKGELCEAYLVQVTSQNI